MERVDSLGLSFQAKEGLLALSSRGFFPKPAFITSSPCCFFSISLLLQGQVEWSKEDNRWAVQMTDRTNRREGQRGPVADLWFGNLVKLGDLVSSLLDQPTSSMRSEKHAHASLRYAGRSWLAAYSSVLTPVELYVRVSQLRVLSDLLMSGTPVIFIMQVPSIWHFTDEINVKRESCAFQKTQVNGSGQPGEEELADTIVHEFGRSEITEKMGRNNKNLRAVNMQVVSKVCLNSWCTLKMPTLDGLSSVFS